MSNSSNHPAPNPKVDPKTNPGGKLIEVADEQQVQRDPVDKKKGVEANPSAWLGKQGEVNSGLMQENGSSPNRK
jgi:hypothetical protein